MLANRPRVIRVFDKIAAQMCLISPALMLVADILTITLNPGISPLQESISRFATGPYGWLEKTGMFLVAVTFFLIAFSLLRVKSGKSPRSLKLVGWLLVIVAIGFLMISMFNTNVIATLVSFHGWIHLISSGAVSVVFYLACLILLRLMINKNDLRFYGFYNGLTFLVGLTVLLLITFEYRSNSYMGLLERLIAGFNLLWIVLVGSKLIKMARSLSE
jgi:hypothetical protein